MIVVIKSENLSMKVKKSNILFVVREQKKIRHTVTNIILLFVLF